MTSDRGRRNATQGDLGVEAENRTDAGHGPRKPPEWLRTSKRDRPGTGKPGQRRGGRNALKGMANLTRGAPHEPVGSAALRTGGRSTGRRRRTATHHAAQAGAKRDAEAHAPSKACRRTVLKNTAAARRRWPVQAHPAAAKPIRPQRRAARCLARAAKRTSVLKRPGPSANL